MNVTKANFIEAVEEIEALLPSASFVAIDEEMTGISVAGHVDRLEDTPAKRYLRLRTVASRYNIIQFGIALFHAPPTGEADKYIARVYNFYLFPETGPVNMEGAAIAFNRDHGMDWNMWIREGVPYVNRIQAEKLADRILPKDAIDHPAKEEAPKAPMTLSRAADIEMADKAMTALRSWLADEARVDETEFEIITANAYIRRFFYETLATQLPSLIVEARPTPSRGISTMYALRLNEAQKAERATKIRADKEAELARKVGFRRVFKALADARRPIVGHGCMFDFLFAFSHFEGPLPESYAEYKRAFHTLFPIMFDTQLLIQRDPFRFVPLSADAAHDAPRDSRFGSKALGNVYKVFQEEAALAKTKGLGTVEVTFAPSHDRYGPQCDAFHEAGYDAYVTGCVFAHMAQQALAPEHMPRLNGRMTMFRSLYDFNLAGEDDVTAIGVYVHVRGLTGCDATTITSAFAGITAPVPDGSAKPSMADADPVVAADLSVRWINDDSAFVVLPEACRGQVQAMLSAAPDGRDGLMFTHLEDWAAAQDKAEDVDTEPVRKRMRVGDGV